MNSLRREDLQPLKKRLDELSEFVRRLCVEEIPYFSRFTENMRNNLEICFLVQYDGWEHIEYILRRDWLSANHMLIGIPGFDIQVPDPDEKARLVCRFLELVSNVDSYLK